MPLQVGHLLSDYWAWNSSDLLINTERGSFSEFIVSSALDLDLSGTREDWKSTLICSEYTYTTIAKMPLQAILSRFKPCLPIRTIWGQNPSLTDASF